MWPWGTAHGAPAWRLPGLRRALPRTVGTPGTEGGSPSPQGCVVPAAGRQEPAVPLCPGPRRAAPPVLADPQLQQFGGARLEDPPPRASRLREQRGRWVALEEPSLSAVCPWDVCPLPRDIASP